MSEYITLTEPEREIINQAIKLISPFDKEDVSAYTFYYEVKGEEVGREYDTCNCKQCIKLSKNKIRKNYGKYTRVVDVLFHNGGDHENIESCSICFKPLVESLTWIANEFDHHKEHTLNAESMKDSRNAFDIRVILESFPSNDHKLSEYSMNNHDAYARHKGYRDDFKNSVIAYAQKVIDNLKLN